MDILLQRTGTCSRAQPDDICPRQRWKLYSDGRLFDISNDVLEKNPVWMVVAQARKKLQAALDSMPSEGMRIYRPKTRANLARVVSEKSGQDVPQFLYSSGLAHFWPTSRKPLGPRLPVSKGSWVASIQRCKRASNLFHGGSGFYCVDDVSHLQWILFRSNSQGSRSLSNQRA